jgi:hypothetical protein
VSIEGLPILEASLILVFVVVYVGPMVHILASRRSHGGEKFGWFLAELFLPIIAYVVFLIVTQKVVDSNSNS